VGFEASRELLARGWDVAMICRSRERGEKARHELRSAGSGIPSLHLADLSSLDQVRSVGRAVAEAHPELHGLINNAGLYLASRELTDDGFETTLAVNHLAHVLLTLLLRPALAAGGGRVVCVSSEGHRQADLDRRPLEEIFRGEGSYGGFRAYGDSKAANVLFAREADRRWCDDGIRACAVHPGVLATRIWNKNRNPVSLLMRLFKPFMGSPSRGGTAAVRPLAELDAARMGGRYFKRTEEAEPHEVIQDPELARRMWEASLEAVEWEGGGA
jgi:NAD(P)-dependent dehydrogenase (short-subunit alcohol dehydrogenase family)